VFCLCRTKAIVHTDEEQCIVGTKVVDEVRKAVDMGYDLLDLFDFCEYEVTCFTRTPILEVYLQIT